MDVNPSQAERSWPAAVVTGGFQTGVVLMRNLHRRGVRVFCVESNRRQPAFRTIYGKALQCPNPDTEPRAWVEFMIRLSRQIGGAPVLISSSDRFVTAIADHTRELAEYFLFCQSAAIQGLLATKERQYQIAEAHGLPVPRTSFIRSREELALFAAQARFPCLLKPLHFREWTRFPRPHPLFDQKVAVATSEQDLEFLYQLAAQVNPEVVAQEVIEGPDTAKLVYLSCYNQQSERIASCLVRQLRTDPIYFGSASVVEPVLDHETDVLCDQFLRGIHYVGLCEIELKRDRRDGCIKMIEANPRYSITADAAPYAGVDLGWLHYLDLIGKRVIPMTQNGRDFRHVVLFRDLAAIPQYRRENLLTWYEVLQSYRKPVEFFDFDWRDWRVTATQVLHLTKILARSVVRRLS